MNNKDNYLPLLSKLIDASLPALRQALPLFIISLFDFNWMLHFLRRFREERAGKPIFLTYDIENTRIVFYCKGRLKNSNSVVLVGLPLKLKTQIQNFVLKEGNKFWLGAK